MKKKDDVVYIIVTALSIIFGSLLVIGLLALEIYCWVEYGNKPIDEVPTWVVWFLFGGIK